MGVPQCMSCTMLNLSQASVEYVCKHVTSPNIARRFGYKLYEGEAAGAGMEHTSQITNAKMITSEVQTTRSYHHTAYRGSSLYSHNDPLPGPYQVVSRSPSTDRGVSSTARKDEPSRATPISSGMSTNWREAPS